MAINGVDNTQAYKPQRKVAKAVVGTVATAALVTAGLALGAKNGKFAVTEESSAVAKKVLPYLDKAGQAINQFVGQAATKIVNSNAYQTVATKAKEAGVTEAIKDGFEKGKGIADDIAGKVKAADIKGKAATGLETVRNFFSKLVDSVEKHINPAKFDAAKAAAADIAEETFNGFVK